MNRWHDYVVWSMWICMGRYITCISSYRSFQEVLEAIHEKAEELGVYARGEPLVMINMNFLNPEDAEVLRGFEGSVTLDI